MFQVSAWWRPFGVETCSWVNRYFMKLCFDGRSVDSLCKFWEQKMGVMATFVTALVRWALLWDCKVRPLSVLLCFFWILLGQGCRAYGSHARNYTREDFLGTPHSLMPQFFKFIVPNQRFYILKNVCVCVCVCACGCVCVRVCDCMKYSCYQITLQWNFLYKSERCEVLTGYLSMGRRPGGGWANTWHGAERFTVCFPSRKW
jgi:hypothetical protein